MAAAIGSLGPSPSAPGVDAARVEGAPPKGRHDVLVEDPARRAVDQPPFGPPSISRAVTMAISAPSAACR